MTIHGIRTAGFVHVHVHVHRPTGSEHEGSCGNPRGARIPEQSHEPNTP